MVVLLDQDPVQLGMRKSRQACHSSSGPAIGLIGKVIGYGCDPLALPFHLCYDGKRYLVLASGQSTLRISRHSLLEAAVLLAGAA